MDSVELSELMAKDVRWERLRDQMHSIEKVLNDMGCFKPWMIGAKRIDNLVYTGLSGRMNPGQYIAIRPDYKGTAASEFTIEGELPANLTFNKVTGEIRGRLDPGVE